MDDTRPEVVVLPDVAAVQHEAAQRVALFTERWVEAVGRCIVALSGGSTPRGLFRLLAQAPLRDQIPWSNISLIWADERYVPADDPESNYRMARETLIEHVPIPPEQVFPVPTIYEDLNEAVTFYERQLRALAEGYGKVVNLALLGMGPDGHTASLFPGHPALDTPPDQLVVAVEGAPKLPSHRISLTAAALNMADEALFLVTGADKAEALKAVLNGAYKPRQWPAQLVHPPQGRVTWIVDQAAAAGL